MTNVTLLPKAHLSFYTKPTVREMLIKGFQLPDILEVHSEVSRRFAKELEDGGGQIKTGRGGGIFLSTYREKLESLTAEELAVMGARAALFKDINVEKLTDTDWQRLATMGWC